MAKSYTCKMEMRPNDNIIQHVSFSPAIKTFSAFLSMSRVRPPKIVKLGNIHAIVSVCVCSPSVSTDRHGPMRL